MKGIFIKFLLLLTLFGCSTHYCYKERLGKGLNAKYRDLKEREFSIYFKVTNEKDKIYPVILTNRNAPILISDSVNKLQSIHMRLKFKDGDSLAENVRYNPVFKVNEQIFTCPDFKRQFKKNKAIELRLEYDIDSLSVIRHFSTNYLLHRKKTYSVGVH